MKMYCARCGADRTLPPGAGDYGACACGETARCSWQPVPGGMPLMTGVPMGVRVLSGTGTPRVRSARLRLVE